MIAYKRVVGFASCFTPWHRTMVDFKALIALDLETTSLPQFDHNTTKITELAVIGCEVDHVKNSSGLPRVLHKLVLLFNPNKTISLAAEEISGLSNNLLSNLKPFRKEDVEILRNFIERLPQPVCIIAHNGNAFDYPILRAAIDKVNMELQNNVYCADSLKAFRTLLKEQKATTSKISKGDVTPPTKKPPTICQEVRKHVVRELFPDDEAFSEWSANFNDDLMIHTCKSYQLEDVYEYFFKGKFKNAHSAEVDAQALLACAIACDGFLEWIAKNAVVFNSIQPLF